MAEVKIKLKNHNVNVRAFGLEFDEDGFCVADKKLVQSLIDEKLVSLVTKDDEKYIKDLKENN